LNVSDFSNTLPEGEDLLKVIFKRQVELMEKYDPIEEKNLSHHIPHGVFNLDDPQSQQRLKDFAWRVTEELGEAMNCLKNKPWKQTHMPTDEVHFLEELVDAFHFLIEMYIHVGFTPETLTAMYLNKSDVNKFRIRSKY
jgi:dimeric dUTPase (all-alpha-NTP-PPase superfamily)